MLARDMRMVDMQIMASLQNGTAFFASTSLIAIGGALTLLRSTDEIHAVVISTLAVRHPQTSRGLWETKTDRAGRDLRLRVLQIRLVVPAVQLTSRSCSARRPFAADKDTPGGRGACDAHRAAVRIRPAGISTAASARSSSRSAISAGSSARSSCC